MQALASARFDWEQSLRDLSRALPSDVYLSSLKGTVGGGACAGGGSGLRGAIGSAPGHRALRLHQEPARRRDVMSRLRNVQGVTRVSLAKSEKSTPSPAGGATRQPVRQGLAPELRGRRLLREGDRRRRLSTATGDDRRGRHRPAAAPADATGKGTDDSAAKPSSTPAATPGG